MKTLRILTVSFDTHIYPWELPQFRGAVAKKVGLEHEWYHNHDNEQGGYHQRYPLIQYKIDGSRGQFKPMLMCLHQGVEEAHHLFSQPDWQLHVGRQEHALRIARLHLHEHPLEVLERAKHYRLHHWRPFNPENYQHYRSLQGLADQFAFLERLLSSQIIAFAGGVEWQVEPRFDLKITDLLKSDWVDYKGVKVMSFTLDFSCTLHLPEYIGLGKGVSLGYGVVRGRERR